MSLENQINQLKTNYNTNLSILIRNTNNAISSIINSNVYNKNGRIATLVQQFKVQVNAMYAKLMSDIEKLRAAALAPVVAPVVIAVSAPVSAPVAIKRAFLVGINYIGTPYELRGCINDVENIKSKLVSSYGYNDANIVTITDNTTLKPTRAVILEQFKNVLVNSVAGDQIFFVKHI